jgi:hypothetical protein
MRILTKNLLFLSAFFLLLSLPACQQNNLEVPVSTTQVDEVDFLYFTSMVTNDTNLFVKNENGKVIYLLEPVRGINVGLRKPVCQGDGIKFVKCCKGYLDQGKCLNVYSCGGEYCADETSCK